MATEYVLYCDPSAILSGLECNEGIDEVLKAREEYPRKGIALRVVDSGQMSEQEIKATYFRAIQPSVLKKYRVRQIFGSRKHAASLFARGVAALVVQDSASHVPDDVFPHREAAGIVTIRDALNRALPA